MYQYRYLLTVPTNGTESETVQLSADKLDVDQLPDHVPYLLTVVTESTES